MVELIILGTVGIDSIKTPFGVAEEVLGGSAVYSALAASFFLDVGIVSIIGEDFPKEHITLLKKRGINTEGLQVKGTTFRWKGEYEYDMNEAKTIATEINCLSEFKPELPEKYKKAKYCFLANTDPELQISILKQLKKPRLVVLDTMNYWIQTKRDRVIEAIGMCDILVVNDAEARQLFETVNLVDAAKKGRKMGVKTMVIKKGEHGALLFSNGRFFFAPGFPLEIIKDPTGCGDSFAGAFIGYLGKCKDIDESSMRKGIIYGSTVASFNAEDFSLNKLKVISMMDIEKRYNEFEEIVKF
ncbi:MAG: PfkB family carbohydrate kinase [Candidatus Woesearchaeota archaeon]